MANDTVKRLEEIWNQSSPTDRIDWIWKAGFTKAAAAKYRDLTWSSLPDYVRQTLEDQED